MSKPRTEYKKLLAGPQMRPISSGTEGMNWYAHNCDRCVRAYHPQQTEEGDYYPCDKTMREYVRIGKECKLKYFMDLAWICSTIPVPIAAEVGNPAYGGGVASRCQRYSQNPQDKYRPVKRRRYARKPVDENQLVLFPDFSV